MQSVTVYKKRRMSRAAKLLLSVFGITITAICISYVGNGTEQGSAKKFWKNALQGIGVTMSLQTVENYSPVLKYGLYSAAGHTEFANWEMTLLSESLGKKQNTMLDMVQQIASKNEETDVQTASTLDETLIIDRAVEENNESTEVGIIYGENYFETSEPVTESTEVLSQNVKVLDKLKNSLSLEYLINNFYIVDSTTSIDKSVFNVEKLLKKDCTLSTDSEKPQILIYHTHGGSESFVDSDGTKGESVVGVGSVLAKILTEDYGYNVIHDETCYDVINGKIDRDKAYDKALVGLEKTLKKYPSIEVVIDLHRDKASQNKKRVTTIEGKETAQIMFFNGLSRKSTGEDRDYLKNSNLQGNLAFSLQMKMKAMELYPNITTKIYLKGYRYNLHLREKSLLIELGTNMNTIAEAKNAMEPLAEVLNEVLNE